MTTTIISQRVLILQSYDLDAQIQGYWLLPCCITILLVQPSFWHSTFSAHCKINSWLARWNVVGGISTPWSCFSTTCLAVHPTHHLFACWSGPPNEVWFIVCFRQFALEANYHIFSWLTYGDYCIRSWLLDLPFSSHLFFLYFSNVNSLGYRVFFLAETSN